MLIEPALYNQPPQLRDAAPYVKQQQQQQPPLPHTHIHTHIINTIYCTYHIGMHKSLISNNKLCKNTACLTLFFCDV